MTMTRTCIGEARVEGLDRLPAPIVSTPLIDYYLLPCTVLPVPHRESRHHVIPSDIAQLKRLTKRAKEHSSPHLTLLLRRLMTGL
jgi:hypothetical protein